MTASTIAPCSPGWFSPTLALAANLVSRPANQTVVRDTWAAQEEEGAEMLVLSRHRDESIIIGDDIVITVVDVRGDKVRLGIDAPTDIPVHRQEVYEAIQRERSGNANGAPQKNSR